MIRPLLSRVWRQKRAPAAYIRGGSAWWVLKGLMTSKWKQQLFCIVYVLKQWRINDGSCCYLVHRVWLNDRCLINILLLHYLNRTQLIKWSWPTHLGVLQPPRPKDQLILRNQILTSIVHVHDYMSQILPQTSDISIIATSYITF